MKTAIITGASSGIGRAVAEKLAHAGWSIGLIARRSDVLEEMAASLPDAMALPCDVSDAAAVEEAFAVFAAKYGHLALLFNNAGVFTPQADIDDVPLDDWDRALSVNLTGMFLCARQAFGQMKRQEPRGGRIINNGSVSAHVPRPQAVTYTVTKHAITGLTKQLALDGRELDICCGQIDIGNTYTEMLADISDAAIAKGETPPPSFDVSHVADSVLAMAELPLNANVLFQTIMARGMPYVGRG
ncbi:SDR family oxidoreductase [Marivivens donghaensis]|uniref:SDR family oxidoreductase n=1 Tax=Marivivens donghaensis TaxID=1699413 RepID=A0ABX0VVJ3_9RHOB|nr:SDR family oxidoreductase [Marivivens donghaensis]NIY72127.1 SDR family oxidoreductase [Marivivens donghaensis]